MSKEQKYVLELIELSQRLIRDSKWMSKVQLAHVKKQIKELLDLVEDLAERKRDDGQNEEE